MKIILWWETRRIFYNLAVGAVGLMVCASMLACGLVCEKILGESIGIPDPPAVALIFVAIYGIMANVCYTAGWIAELILRAIWQGRAGHFGEISFAFGLVFSILLTCLPGVLVFAVASHRLLLYYSGHP
ncbi:MAG: hypothetical protein U1G07_23470 [Verrucomicrobiota bacterium]